jgi:hypothetical protein
MYQFGELLAELPDGWGEVTDELPEPGSPLTLVKEDGVGALQFSSARYLSGEFPNPTLLDLQRLLEDKAAKESWGDPISLQTGTRSLMFASGEYRIGEAYMRAWYLSDGLNFVFATYNCDWHERARERRDVDSIIATLRFSDDAAGSD